VEYFTIINSVVTECFIKLMSYFVFGLFDFVLITNKSFIIVIITVVIFIISYFDLISYSLVITTLIAITVPTTTIIVINFMKNNQQVNKVKKIKLVK
jgi:hypothetical protein